jgi:hypothetical protein
LLTLERVGQSKVSTGSTTSVGRSVKRWPLLEDGRVGGPKDESILANSGGDWQYLAELEEGENTFDFFLQEDDDVRATVTVVFSPSPAESREPAETARWLRSETTSPGLRSVPSRSMARARNFMAHSG